MSTPAAPRDDGLGNRGRLLDDMLAVVEHEQHALVPQESEQTPAPDRLRCAGTPSAAASLPATRIGSASRAEINEGHGAAICRQHGVGDSQRHRRLADPSWIRRSSPVAVAKTGRRSPLRVRPAQHAPGEPAAGMGATSAQARHRRRSKPARRSGILALGTLAMNPVPLGILAQRLANGSDLHPEIASHRRRCRATPPQASPRCRRDRPAARRAGGESRRHGCPRGTTSRPRASTPRSRSSEKSPTRVIDRLMMSHQALRRPV